MTASATPLRILLDQNFPNPPEGLAFDILDRNVELRHFGAAFPSHANVSTPDWKVYLLAAASNFDAVVTGDISQVSQDTEMVALSAARVGLVTWKSAEQDVFVQYGQLLAYMPQIVKQLRTHRCTVIRLPKAHLKPQDAFARPDDIMRERDQRDGRSLPERRGTELRFMNSELTGTSDEDLAWILKPRRSAR